MTEPKYSYERGYWAGYEKGEGERIALAQANSELRSEIKALKDARESGVS